MESIGIRLRLQIETISACNSQVCRDSALPVLRLQLAENDDMQATTDYSSNRSD